MSCDRKFYHYGTDDFYIIDSLDSDFIPKFNCLDQTYILRLDSLDRFIGGEYVRMRDTASNNSKVQYSYFVFQGDGRVYFNTYADARDSSKIDKESLDEQHINGKLPETIDLMTTSNLYARQGHYVISKYEHITNINPLENAYHKNQNKAYIIIELERKFNPRLTAKFLNAEHRDSHYILTAEIDCRDDRITGDTLKILKVEVPRKINPLTAESSPSKEGNQVLNADDIFTFPLNFIKSSELPEIICEECDKACIETFGCKVNK